MSKTMIIIVEDEVLLANDLKMSLENLGYGVCAIFDTAEKALELIEHDQPDLICMDIVLKGKMDGIEAAEIIRSRWGIPVIFLTAYSDNEILKRAKITEPFGYLVKPVQDRDIKVGIEMAVYKAKMEKEREKLRQDLQEASAEIKTLRGFIPICANCKDVRDDEGYWQKIEQYISEHSKAEFSHSICPKCIKVLYPELHNKLD